MDKTVGDPLYCKAWQWLEGQHVVAQREGDHATQRMIELIQNKLYRLEDLEN